MQETGTPGTSGPASQPPALEFIGFKRGLARITALPLRRRLLALATLGVMAASLLTPGFPLFYFFMAAFVLLALIN